MLTTAIPANGLLPYVVCSTIGYHSNSCASCYSFAHESLLDYVRGWANRPMVLMYYRAIIAAQKIIVSEFPDSPLLRWSHVHMKEQRLFFIDVVMITVGLYKTACEDYCVPVHC